MLNRWIGSGRLTKDPELKKTYNGLDIATFKIAVDRDGKPGDENKKTDFIKVVAWGKIAEFVGKYFTKGSLVIVEGRLHIRSYIDEEGTKRSATEIVADRVHFGESKKASMARNESSVEADSNGSEKDYYEYDPTDYADF